MNVRGGDATRIATVRAQKLIESLGLADEVAVVCIDQGEQLECVLAIPSQFGHHFVLRFRANRQITREKMACMFVEGAELLRAQRDRIALRR